jgi:hypothetical protein
MLKYPAGLPIVELSQDNGNWQPVKAKGKLVEAHLNSTHGMDAVRKLFPARGTQGKSYYGNQYKHLGAHQCQQPE